jgi:glycosyltransferase involved in cell wall biosynthesis
VTARPAVAVIVPAYNATATIGPCLAALGRALRDGDELIVFDDGSTDATGALARAAGASIIRNDATPRGPAFGRNAAARAARSEYLLFVDADVVLAPGAIDLLLSDVDRTGAVAAFGSYDDAPLSRRATSLYANLRHHFVHQQGARDATTFWSGIGLIERQAFLDVDGYDADRFPYPSIEDIDLGVRLIARGERIRLVPEAQGKHCKDWSLWRVWHTDVVRRAWPWSLLIASGQTKGIDLNVAPDERGTALVAMTIPILLFYGLVHWFGFVAAAVAAAVYFYRNRRFFGFLARRLNAGELVAAIAMHWCYHLYASVTFAVALLGTRLGLVRHPA